MLPKHFWIQFLASFGFLGFSPVAPGTAGSLGGVLLYWILTALGAGAALYLLFLLFFIALSIAVANSAEKTFPDKDPGPIVVDEVAGMLITLWVVPLQWQWILLGFLLFRALDILKPYPARQCEQFKGGWGIVLDDVVSGIYAWVLLQAIILLT